MGISYHTLYGWVKEARKGNFHLEKRSDSNVSRLEEELQQLRRANKELAKENKRLQEENEFLGEATAFFSLRAVRSLQKRKNEIHSSENQRWGRTWKIAFYCRALDVTRQRFYDYLKNRDKP